MNALQEQRQLREARPTLENLDSRIAPTAISAAALAAELKSKAHRVSRWEASLATARPGSRQAVFLTNHIAAPRAGWPSSRSARRESKRRKHPQRLRRLLYSPLRNRPPIH